MEDPLGPGVREVEHTADVGIVVEASDFEQLLHRAAVGVFALMYGKADADLGPTDLFNPLGTRVHLGASDDQGNQAGMPRPITVVGSDPAAILLKWLRELLFLHETEGLAYRRATFDVVDEERVSATVWMGPEPTPAACEFKGVTYHDLDVTPGVDGWRARVILDV